MVQQVSPTKQAARPLLHGAVALAGLVLALGGGQAFLSHLRGPVAETDLQVAGGPLAYVSPCSTGRNARFNYRVLAPEGLVEAWKACPSPLQRELSSRLQQTVMVKYRTERNLIFMPSVQVYELRIDNGTLWSVAETNAQLQATRWLMALLALLAMGAGLAMVGLGWREGLKGRAAAAPRITG